MSIDLTFSVVNIRRVAPKPDGTPRRNSFELDILVDGVPHAVRIRRESGALRGETIVDHPHYAEIHRRVVDHLTTVVLEPARQEWQRRRAAAIAR